MNRQIETERLILRPLSPSDAQDVFAWVGDPVVNRYMPYPLYTDVHEVEKWLRTIEEKNEFGFSLKETGKIIGAGSISYCPEFDAYELGYNLNRDFWGLGYATEASRAMIQWAFRELGAREFIARHATANVASGRVIVKCGFRFDHYGTYSRFDDSEVFEASYYTLHLD